jgi:hypothetical protein
VSNRLKVVTQQALKRLAAADLDQSSSSAPAGHTTAVCCIIISRQSSNRSDSIRTAYQHRQTNQTGRMGSDNSGKRAKASRLLVPGVAIVILVLGSIVFFMGETPNQVRGTQTHICIQYRCDRAPLPSLLR